ncbi:hypothetical protein ACFE04_006640 [Oxalis oulophora]
MDAIKLIPLLKKCTSLKQGKLIHQKILTRGLQNNIALCKNLINVYISCHDYNSTMLVFNSVTNPLDISLWNSLLVSYTKSFMFNDALQLFDKLLQYPVLKPDSFTYPSVLKACAALGNVSFGKMIHSHLIKTGFLYDVVVSSTVVSMYAKCNVFVDSINLFDEMPERDVGCWNTVISCCYQDGHPEKALELYERMRSSGFEPNSVTLTTVISSCARVLDLEKGKFIHMELERNGFALDDYVSSALIDLYGKCGCLDLAREVFEQMQSKTVIACNSMIAGCSLKGDSKSSIEIFARMTNEGTKPSLTTLSCMLMACSKSGQLRHGKFVHGYIIRNRIIPDIFVNCTLMDLYFKCGKFEAAEHVFEKTPKETAAPWNVMISGYVTAGNYFKALDIYSKMKGASVKPNAITFTSILQVSSQLTVLQKGEEIHKEITKSKLENNHILMGALLDMYTKCGAVDQARNVFDKLSERDILSWTSMISAYGSNGQAFEALKLFDEMDIRPDEITFLAVLSACSHAGMVDRGFYYFNQMILKYSMKPKIEHYSCLIDLLGRAGKLREAYEIYQNTPEISGDSGVLSTLFSACRLHKNLEMGEEIARLLIEKDPEDVSTYVILSHLYASAGEWDEVRRVRLKMKKFGLRKNPGYSWIEIDQKIESFHAEDTLHPETEIVYQCLDFLASHMEKDEVPDLIVVE